MDHQVKIRGFRIELGEIEHQLLSLDGIKTSAVIVMSEKGENYLCAYFTSNTDKKIEIPQLRDNLAKKLPNYMIPAYFKQIEIIPLTPSGKVDRKALASIGHKGDAEIEFVAPQNETEKIVAEVWKEVLGIEQVGIYDNFFNIGGNSLKLITLSTKLNTVLGTEIPPAKLFEHVTIDAFARYYTGKERRESRKERKGQIPVTGDLRVNRRGDEIAIIGMAGKFPGARNIDEFWDNLKNGIESISFMAEEELKDSGIEPGLIKNPNYVNTQGGVLEDRDCFDAFFFDYSEPEASIMDPQARVFHECAWEAVENAGYNTSTYEGTIGVYAGASSSSRWEGLMYLSDRSEEVGGFAAAQLANKDFMCTHIAYKLDLKGPAVNIQTTCSTSLVAVHMACRALLEGDCDMALAGGVSVSFEQHAGYLYQEGLIQSPDGHCRAFDANARGTISGNGTGVVLLKPFKDALANNDYIYAIIRATAINNNGTAKAGYTAPSIKGQAAVIQNALQLAEVDPETITYVETHGTGTTLGDPIEIEALKQAYNTNKRQYCAVGSVKTNIGHLDAAAGIAGLIKTVLALKNKLIPPSLHFEKANPKIDFENSPFYVNPILKEWKSEKGPRLAGVSSFGIGGTNAHAVLEEAPGIEPRGKDKDLRLILLSARTETALEKITANLAEFLIKNRETHPGDTAYTLQVGRNVFEYKRMIVCSGVDNAVEALSSLPPANVKTFFSKTKNPPVVFMFPGQGAQYVNMGLELYQNISIFRDEMDRCFEILKPLLGLDIKEIIYPSGQSDQSDRPDYSDRINQTDIAQPVIFTFEYALAKLLMAWGIKPYAMIGHSIGEYTAACLAGVFSLEDALTLVGARGRLVRQMPGGSMLGVPLSQKDLEPLLNDELSLAAVNGPAYCVVSGTHGAIDAFEKRLKEKGYNCTRLHTSHAFHSRMMDPVLKEFEDLVSRVRLNKPGLPYISNVTGNWITVQDVKEPVYWAAHLRKTVKFETGISELLKIQNPILVEVGPGKSLSTFVRQHKDKEAAQQVLNLVRHPKENVPDKYYLLSRVGQLWLYGVKIDWPAFYGEEKRSRIPLLAYPFEHRYYRVDEGLLKKKDCSFLQPSPGKQTKDLASLKHEDKSLLRKRPNLSTPYMGYRDPLEKALVDIWERFFGMESIGIYDDFFELGGDSLKAITVISRIHKELNKTVSMTEFFNRPFIQGLAEYIRGCERSAYYSIEPQEKREYYLQSSSQKRLYFLQQMDKGGIAYNISEAWILEGVLDRPGLEQSIRGLTRRHESLRTSFHLFNEEAVQVIHDQVEFGIEYDEVEAKVKVEEERASRLEGTRGLAPLSFIRPFDLSKAPLLRVGLVRLPAVGSQSPAHFLLMVDMHHIISDGMSTQVLVEDFWALYAGKELPGTRVQYKDYAAWQNRERPGKKLLEQGEYWKKEYEGETPVLELPVDYSRPAVQGFEGSSINFEINREIAGVLKALALETGTTLYILLLALYNIFLAKVSSQEDIVIGTPVAGRRQADLEKIIGMFVNTLALRNYPSGEKKFIGFLEEVKEKALEAFENQEYPYEDLVEKVSVTRDVSRNPLFDTMFVLQNTGTQEIEIPGLKLIPYEYENKTSKFDLTLSAVEVEGKLLFTFEYSTKLFKGETVERFIVFFKNLIRGLIENHNRGISDFEIMTEGERSRILNDFNETGREYPRDKTIHRLFEEQAEQIGDRVALVGPSGVLRADVDAFGDHDRRGAFLKEFFIGSPRRGALDPQKTFYYLTYRQLNEKSNRLAGWLNEKGVQPDTIVGIMIERSIEMVIGILGILKAGGTYLPIDPNYPGERIDFMLEDSDAQVLVKDDASCASWLSFAPKTLLNLSEGHHFNFPASKLPSFPASHSSSLAYIIYTSGSTGRPKGVMIDHRAVVNRLYFVKNQYRLDGNDVVLQKTPFTFDVSVCEIFRWILPGARLCLLLPGAENQPEIILNTIAAHKVTTIDFVPSALKVFLEFMTGANVAAKWQTLRWVFIGAEVVRPELAAEFNKAAVGRYNAQLIDAYGPTEATVDVTYFNCSGSEPLSVVPIGKPMANVRVFILDRTGHLQCIGIPGELCIAGDSLARGYLNNPELTSDKFDHDLKDYRDYHEGYHRPYRSHKSYIIYHTGDLARWLSDGNIVFLGRMDHQAKIRGFRVEPGEIENRLSKYPGIKEAVVLAQGEEGDNYLCAYVVPDGENVISELRGALSKELPEYLIPSYFVKMEKIPLTPSGKVDRKALPKPSLKVGEGYAAPGNEIEKKLVRLWAGILGRDAGHATQLETSIGISDNFFELGGHSLKATIMMSKIHKELEVKIDLMEIFRNPTIRDIARLIQGLKKEAFHDIEPMEKKEYYPLSSAQKRLYFLQQLDLNSTGYNMPMVLPLGQGIKKDKLESILKRLIARHESLRTSIERVNEEVVQRIHPADSIGFSLDYYEPEKTGIEEIIKSYVRPFDLSRAPLMRSGIITHPDGHCTWMVDIHHIVSDGTSHTILAEDFMRLYGTGVPLEPLPIQYKDFAQWQNRLFASGRVKDQEDYWLQLYAGEIPRLNLPTDYKRPGVFTFEGDYHVFKLEREDAVKFKTLGVRCGGTLYMNMLAALNTLFYKYTGQTDIIIGSGIAGRRHEDIQGVVGMFVNTLAMRNYPEGEKSYENFLQEVIANSVKAFENQDVQFEELVEKLDPERDTSRNPLLDITMVVQNFRQVYQHLQWEIINENIPGSQYKNPTSKFDLTFFILESEDDVYINLEYYTAIFKEETAARLANHFKKVIHTVIKKPYIALKDIDILSEKEKKRLLNQFNDTIAGFPRDKTIHRLIEEQVDRTPDYVALVYKDQIMTYQELDRQANRLAGCLFEEKRVGIGEPVGIWMSQPIYRQVAVLAILKAGGAFVPMDPAAPPERIGYIINDARIGVVISGKGHLRDLNRLQWECGNFHSYLCSDSVDIYAEEEQEKNQLMDRELWRHVGESAIDDITGGGWLSSYTGLPFSREEMNEYGGNILKKLEPLLHPGMKVLEIGCASGISMYRIAPKVGLYYGTDLSEVIIEKNKKQVREKGFHNIELACLPAHEIHRVPVKDFDLVIINSVIQCFHGHNYLRKVLEKAVELLKDHGYLFIGDVMNQEKKDALVRELTAFKEANRHMGYTTKTDFSAELFVSPGFWQDLGAEWDEIETVTCSDKIFSIENELTKFRYDVLVKVSKARKAGRRKNREVTREKLKYQDDMRAVTRHGGAWLGPDILAVHLAYIIYTSGSTGKPKGVMVEHCSLVNLCCWHNTFYSVTAWDRATKYAGFSFDASVWEVFPYLVTGASICIVPGEIKLEIEALNRYYENNGVTVSFLPTQVCEQFMVLNNTSLRVLLTGGDKLKNYIRKNYRLYNNYGPTENTVVTTAFWVTGESGNIPIGKPVANNQVYILDGDNYLQPVGVPGELCIGGEGVARGYLNRAELTCEKFDHDLKDYRDYHEGNHRPYRSHKFYIIYHTGDLARWLDDGNLEFLGRIDNQVKIRGFRIELGEIENRLLNVSGVKEAVVIAREEVPDDKYLCAYFVSAREYGLPELREYLAKELPGYMIPAYFVRLEKFPLTSSGKLDRKALPKPGVNIGESYTAAQNEIETKLVELWAEILGRDALNATQLQTSIGIDDNFFELGGHSLKATTMMSKIHKELEVKVELKEIFRTPTIRDIARLIQGLKKEAFQDIEPMEKKEYYPLSSAQKRLYFLQQLDLNSTGYNIPMVLPLGKGIRKDKLESILKRLIARHESLRTSIERVNEEVVQRIHESVEFEVGYYNLATEVTEDTERKNDHYPKNHELRAKSYIQSFIRPFDLSRAPLIRSGLIRHPDGNHIWMVDIHHIVSDGTSHTILTEDFMRSYGTGALLEPLSIQYKDFAQWQNRLLASGLVKSQEDYWLQLYSGEIPRLNLATDYIRPGVFTFEGDYHVFKMEREDAVKFKTLGARYGGTLYMNMLAALNMLFYKYTGQTDIIIGSGIAGRRHEDIQGVVGMFVNTLAMRNYPGGEKSYENFLKEVIANSIKGFENQDVQFEELVEQLEVERDPSHNPLFDISLVVQNFRRPGERGSESRNFGHAEVLPISIDENSPAISYRNLTTKMDLTFFIHESGEDVNLMIEYYTRIFSAEYILRLASHLKNVIKTIIRKPSIKLKDIEIMSEEERQEVVYTFNDTGKDFLKNQTVISLFEEQVGRRQDRVALVFRHNQLTYRELACESNRLLRYLHEMKGIKREEPVGIMLDSGSEQVAAILGVLKSGGVYVPISPSLPLERKKNIIKDLGIGIVLSEKRYIGDLNRLQWECESFESYLCMDSKNVYEEEEYEKSGLMDKELWEHIGESSRNEIEGGGWKSSYTGEWLSKEEMDEYGDNILRKLEPLLHPEMQVLEIGCASGISMYRIAPKVGMYYGTDISGVIIERNKRKTEEEGYKNIKLSRLAAHEIDLLKEEAFDLVIINSVIQAFHGHNYLRQVIRRCIDKMNAKGYLFLGDIMDQGKKAAMIRELKEFKNANRGKGYKTKTDFYDELFISRGFLEDLEIEIEEIAELKISEKIYRIENELTRFRYDALLKINKKGIRQGEKRERRNKHKYQEDVRAFCGLRDESLRKEIPGDSLAYIIFTSGTVGKPKGVGVEHRGLANYVNWRLKNYGFLEEDVTMQLLSSSFDGFGANFYPALLSGGKLVLVGRDELSDYEKIARIIEQEGVTDTSLVPSMYEALLSHGEGEGFRSMKFVVLAGEKARGDIISSSKRRKPWIKLMNEYGPTEGTVAAAGNKQIEEENPAVIGTPIWNVRIYILGSGNHLQPKGLVGEIFISGAGLARGYLNDQELSARKFFYIAFTPQQSVRLYGTGDLGRWKYDGSIEFLGRIDSQVKIRGYRVELGEIEAQLLNHEAIQEAVVIDRKDEKGDKYLVAYIVSGKTFDTTELRNILSQSLPDYMIPSFFIPIGAIPLTPNGKIDLKALPWSKGEASYREVGKYAAPRDKIEEKLVDIWYEVLGRSGTIGIDDNFFEIGGHSLKATILTSKIHRGLSVKIPLAEVFKRQTIRGLSEYIRGSQEVKYAEINPVEAKEYYGLSSAQKRLYFLQQFDLNSTSYNMPLIFPVGKGLEKDGFEFTLKQLIVRHESLRTSFVKVNEDVVQKIHAPGTVHFSFDYYEADETRSKEIIKHYISPFDLTKAPLIRSGIIKLRDGHQIWMVDIHHIVSDGTSHTILTEDFLSLYNGYKGNKGIELEPLRIQYKDFAQWQNQLVKGGEIRAQEAYWLELYSGEVPHLNLPTDNKRPAVYTFAGDHYGFNLESEDAERLKLLGAHYGGTLYMNMLALLNALFYKYTGQTDIIIGSGIAGRRHADLQGVVGIFVNTLVMRNYPAGEKSYEDFLQEVISGSVKGFENQDVQFEELVERLEVERDPSRNPLFDISLVVQNFRRPGDMGSSNRQRGNTETLPLPEENVPAIGYENKTSKCDMTFFVHEWLDDISIKIEYYTGIFKLESIRRLSGHFRNIIKAILENPSIKLSDIVVMSAEEMRQVLYEFNNTAVEYPKGQTIHGLFEGQVERTPDHAALIYEDQMLTYKELDRYTSRLAHYLYYKRGIRPYNEERVGVTMSSPLYTAEAVLGILKTGGVYVPLEPSIPRERMKYMIDDACIGTVISEKRFIRDMNRLQWECKGFDSYLCVDSSNVYGEEELEKNESKHKNQDDRRALPGFGWETFRIDGSPDNLAYIIYTSGTTGEPKGVEIEHRSAVNMLLYRKEEYGMNPGVVSLQLFSYSFDGFVASFFTPLLSGSKTVLMSKEDIGDIEKTREAVIRNGVTHFISVPSLYSALLERLSRKEFSTIKAVTLAGDKVSLSILEDTKARSETIEIVNEYGVTEGAVMSSIYRNQERDNKVKIGHPVWNTAIYILDETQREQPVGVVGELCISGEGLARGYLNQPGLTAEKFCLRRPGGRFLKKLPPWTPRKNFLSEGTRGLAPLFLMEPGKRIIKEIVPLSSKLYPRPYALGPRLYKTGDLARWLPDGNIEFSGRIDQQVKIRGFRIELGEIEARLLKHYSVKDSVVIDRKKNGETYLCAYIVSLADEPVDPLELGSYLSRFLPGYMIPHHFIKVDHIPMTVNGKIDRKAFPAPRFTSPGDYTAPANDVEDKLTLIWSEVLAMGREKISMDSNFFQLGGHSLKATILVSKIHKEFDVKVPLSEIFKTPRIKELAKYIKGKSKDIHITIESVEEKEYYQLSPAQKRLYILQQLVTDNTAYNMPYVIPLGESVEKKKLESVFKKLIERHESLRTSFITVNEEPVQRIHREVDFSIGGYEVTEESGGDTLIPGFITPFNLNAAPLLRVNLIDVGTSRRVLFIDMHHIITDGTSQGILEKEFLALQEGEALQPLRLQYKDYSEWNNSALRWEAIKKQESYWMREFSGEIPALDIPTDYPRPSIQGVEGNVVSFSIDEEEAGNLKQIAAENDSTLYMFLLAVFNVLLSKLSGQEDIIIGTPIAARRHADLEHVIGMLVNTLAIRNYPSGDKLFREFLKEVNRQTLAAYDNQEYPFEMLVDKITVDRDTGRNPVFDVMFNLLNQADYKGNVTDQNTPGQNDQDFYRHEKATSKFDMNLTAVEIGERLFFTLEYSTRLFKPGGIERIIGYYKNILKVVLRDTGLKISGIEIMDKEGQEAVLRLSRGIEDDYEGMKTLHLWFEEQAGKTPDQVALVGPKLQNTNYKQSGALRADVDAFGGMTAPGDRSALPVQPVQPVRPVSLTYRELNEKSNRLANHLREKGAGPHSIVGLMVERSLEMIIGILGILKAGGAYLSIDSEYPAERKRYMLADGEVRWLLVSHEIEDIGDEMMNRLEVMDLGQEEIYGGRNSNLEYTGSGSDLLYVIYTSGSTGKPKGVMLEHRNLTNLLMFQFKYTNIECSRILQFSTISFDVSFHEIFSAFLSGGQLYLVNKETRTDIPELFRLIERNGIKTVFLPISFLKAIFKEEEYINRVPRSIRHIQTAGEQVVISDNFRKYLKERKVYLHNHYGPAETHVVTVLTIDPGGEIMELPSIGKPVMNTGIYIMDKWGKLLPAGAAGEIWIGGVQVGRGYLNRPELTYEKFKIKEAHEIHELTRIKVTLNKKAPGGGTLRRPFGPSREPLNCGPQLPIPCPQLPTTYHSPLTTHHSPIYQTGDLARWLENGNIEFLGRIDYQVKIRGYRIELGEIESHLRTHPGIKEALVIAQDDRDRKYLCAYIVPLPTPGEGPVQPQELKEYLEKKLPGYMIPACFVNLENIPLNPNGKINLKALPQSLESDFHTGSTYEAPKTDIQRIIAETWQEVLGREKVGIQDNFFDLGGNSLDIVKVANKLKKKLDREIPVVTLFTNTNISSLECYLTRGQEENPRDETSADRYRLIDESKELITNVLRELDEDEEGE